MTDVWDRLRGGVIVSAQAMDPRSPLARPELLALLARASELGGAAGFRVDGSRVVAELRPHTRAPIIAITKRSRAGRSLYITPTVADAAPLIDAGADIVAVDASGLRRPDDTPFAELADFCHRRDVAVLADIATVREAKQAVADGADAVATTLAGYTPESAGCDRPAVRLASELVATLGVPVIVEGGVWETGHVRAALGVGSWAVVVGAAVTAPDLITARLVEAARGGTPSAGGAGDAGPERT